MGREERVKKQWDDGKRELKTMGQWEGELKTMGRQEERVKNNGTTGRES